MAYCYSNNFVPFLPTPWRDLAELDKQIVADLAKSPIELTYFVDWLHAKNERKSCFKSFVERHSFLCLSAIALLTPEQKPLYISISEKICVIAFGPFAEGHGTFFYGYSGLPKNWREKSVQEEAMISYLENNIEDLEHFVHGLGTANGVYEAGHSYPRLCLSAVAMLYRYKAHESKYLETLSKVQCTTMSLILSCYNETLVKYGCSKGLGAFVGWLLENDPIEHITKINKKILHVESKIDTETAEEEVEILKNELKECHEALKDLARPFRVVPDQTQRM